jgi:hypothetical protein
MNNPNLNCRDERRRRQVREQANTDNGLNGIDYVEVVEDGGHGESEDGKPPEVMKGSQPPELCVHFFGDVPENLVPANVRIECGERIRDIKVTKIKLHDSPDPEHEDCLRVTIDKAGDFSCYKLCLYELEKDGDTSDKPLKGFDPRYACATFSFKTNCPGELDCKDENACSPEPRDEPEINYLAKDYASFRQLILDRLALLVPDWRERHVPDLGIALVEVLAYAGDYLSYYQDAVATEAYLDTARQRISVRRHARLVDYFMHEGCNARAWVCLETKTEVTELDPKDFYFITGCAELNDFEERVISREVLDELNIPPAGYDVFQPLVKDDCQSIKLYAAHSKISFYTWGNAQCCLPRGATRATLLDRLPEDEPPVRQKNAPEKSAEHQIHKRALYLSVGDVLIFEEVVGAKTGAKADADPARRCAVRLTRVERAEDPLTNEPLVEIEWSAADALPFELCLSSKLSAPDCRLLGDISVARGNVILVDSGKTVNEAIEDAVPTAQTVGECACEGAAVEFTDIPGKFRFELKNSPLTFSQPPSFKAPASACLKQNPRDALPSVKLYGKPSDFNAEAARSSKHSNPPKEKWLPKLDLLSSAADERNFVVEIDNEGRAHVRFGDGECGKMPAAGMTFTARYRIGNGTKGNVGAETIRYMVTRELMDDPTLRPRNPMPAQGGVQAEPISEVKLFAPGAFRKKRERAITAEDYAQLAALDEKIQSAAGNLRWTGSWYEARVDLDPRGAEELGGRLRRESKGFLYRYRRIGHDLSVARARYVPLDIEFEVCVAPHYLRGHVAAALRDAFGNRVLPNGRRGFFHPDNLTFGGGIYLSALVAAAQKVEGVASVGVKKLQRFFENENGEIAKGILPLRKNEIAQLDNNPNFPERGKLTLTLKGGR